MVGISTYYYETIPTTDTSPKTINTYLYIHTGMKRVNRQISISPDVDDWAGQQPNFSEWVELKVREAMRQGGV